MFDFLKGTLQERNPETAIVETNGIGWTCHISSATYEKLPPDGEVKLFTHLYSTDNVTSMYGFFDRSERDLFRILISANRIGPRTAISLLSEAPPSRISRAIVSNETSLLKRASGIGDKTAKRMIVELQDKIGEFAAGTAGEDVDGEGALEESLVENATRALEKLGYAESESRKAVRSVADSNSDIEDTSSLVKLALKEVS